MSDFFAMTEIAEVEKWPPWPRDNVQLRFNENCKKAIEADFEDLVDWPFIRICHGDYIWAFGSNPSGVEHIETLRGNATGVMPRLGWQGIKIESPKARRFASCVVMAKMCADDAFRNLQDESKPPTKGCLGRGQWGRQNEGCHVQSEAIFIQLYDPMNPEHQLHGEHKYRECPECFRTGDQCSRLAGGTVNWDRCEIPMSSGSRSRNGVDAWMEGRCFHPTEAGLETTVTFEGIQVSVLCYPDVFALEKPVWELGQKAARRNNNRSLFDTAFKLLNDRTLGEEPTSLAHVLLLVSHATKPTPTGLGKKVQWRATTAVNAAASAEICNVLMGAVTSDVQRQGEHLRQKNAIAEVLKDQFGFSSRPKTGDPHGWITFGLRKPQEWNGREVEECFHGTAMTALAPILLEGLKKPHRQDVAHGQCGSPLKESIYLSPSWHYSAHPVYSPLHVVGRRSQLAFQMVLKCEVLRGEYSKQGNTLGNDKWPHHLRIDPERDSLEDLEYLVDDEGTVRLKEVMFRQFGRDADPNVYGDLPPRLRVDSEKGLEYRWTKMLQEDFKARGLYLSGRQHA